MGRTRSRFLGISHCDCRKFALGRFAERDPGNLYAFCSEAAHYSLYKSMEATGHRAAIRLIRVRTNADSSMDIDDLAGQNGRVIADGGVPIYIVATTGTTDAMGIDDLAKFTRIVSRYPLQHGLRRPHIHADSALGGFFAFFNDYDFDANPLELKADVAQA